MPMTKSQGQALTTLLHQLRKDWGLPGIAAAIRKASLGASAADVAVAACRCAADPSMRTPGLIPTPGPHWQGTTAGTRLAPVMCSEHPERKAGGCVDCLKAAVPKPEDFEVPQRDRRLKVWQAGGDGPWTPADEPTDLQRVRDLIDADNEATL